MPSGVGIFHLGATRPRKSPPTCQRTGNPPSSATARDAREFGSHAAPRRSRSPPTRSIKPRIGVPIKGRTVIHAALSVTVLAASLANAGTGENDIIQNVSPLLNNAPIEKVLPSERPGLYGILTPDCMYHIDKTGANG